ncbi:hypothetical protein HII31_07082 [Pseudocercospora fuligena]|uniref:Uncharacterized protein n=1 Tax=Pseudocercospora fuligena TaxID=685502 RepID=A0A8H6RGT5_9PEZI|nr:hypothetical protein HII31_07082 [Pseudocercospora fuligena]
MPLVKRAPEAAPSVVQTGSKASTQAGGKSNGLPIDQLSAQLHRVLLSKEAKVARQTPTRSLSTSSVSSVPDDNPGLPTTPYSASSPEASVVEVSGGKE